MCSSRSSDLSGVVWFTQSGLLTYPHLRSAVPVSGGGNWINTIQPHSVGRLGHHKQLADRGVRGILLSNVDSKCTMFFEDGLVPL